MIDIEKTEAHVYAQLKELLFARHLRPRLLGLLAIGNIFASGQFHCNVYIFTQQ